MERRRGSLYGLLLFSVLLLGALGAAMYYLRPLPPEEELVGPQPGERPDVPAAKSSCVLCHRNLPGTFIGHTFADWEGSRHAEQGVSCHDCHGGDPREAEKERAHLGVISSRMPQSPLYFTQIPQTCGRCHSGELGHFRTSVHFEQLKQTGQGPNCVTCHGAMAIEILRPEELAATCTACHNERMGILPDEPIKTRFLLELMVRASERLELVAELIALSKDKLDTKPAEELLKRAREELRRTHQAWHTFKLAGVEKMLQEVFSLADEAIGRLQAEGS